MDTNGTNPVFKVGVSQSNKYKYKYKYKGCESSGTFITETVYIQVTSTRVFERN